MIPFGDKHPLFQHLADKLAEAGPWPDDTTAAVRESLQRLAPDDAPAVVEHGAEFLLSMIKQYPTTEILGREKDFTDHFAELIERLCFGTAPFTLLALAELYFAREDLFWMPARDSKSEDLRQLQFSVVLLLALGLKQFLEHFLAGRAISELFARAGLLPVPHNFFVHGRDPKFASPEYFFKVRTRLAAVEKKWGAERLASECRELGLAGYLAEHFQCARLTTATAALSAHGRPNFFAALFQPPGELPGLPSEGPLFPQEQLYFSPDFIIAKLKDEQVSEPAVSFDVEEAVRTRFPDAKFEHIAEHYTRQFLLNESLLLQLCRCAKRNYKVITKPTIDGETRLRIFDKLYVTKRIHNLRATGLFGKLAHYVVKALSLELISVDLANLSEVSISYDLKRSLSFFTHEEPQSNDIDDDAKRFARKLGRMWKTIVENLVRRWTKQYLAYYLDVGLFFANFEFGQSRVTALHEALLTLPACTSIYNASALSHEQLFKAKLALFAFSEEKDKLFVQMVKGLRVKHEFELQVRGINNSNRTVDLINESFLENALKDFECNWVVVVTNCKEAYYLRNKLSLHLRSMQLEDSGKCPHIFLFEDKLTRELFHAPLFAQVPPYSRLGLYALVLQYPALASLAALTLLQRGPRASPAKLLPGHTWPFLFKAYLLLHVFDLGLPRAELADPLCRKLYELLLETPLDFDISAGKSLAVATARSASAQTAAAITVWPPGRGKPSSDSVRLVGGSLQQLDTFLAHVSKTFAESEREALCAAMSAKIAKEKPATELPPAATMLMNSCDVGTLVFMRNMLLALAQRPVLSRLLPVQKFSSDDWSLLMFRYTFGRRAMGFMPGALVQLRVTDVNENLIRGTVNQDLNGLMVAECVSAPNVKVLADKELRRYFSKNEVVHCFVQKLYPMLLRADLVYREADFANMRQYLVKNYVMREVHLDLVKTFKFVADSDLPPVKMPALEERNFDFFAFDHPLFFNKSLRELKAVLRESAASDFAFKPADHGQTHAMDCLFYLRKHDLFEKLKVLASEIRTSYVVGGCQLDGEDALAQYCARTSAQLTSLSEHLCFTKLPEEKIVAELQAMRALSAEFVFFVAKNPEKDFHFDVFYLDANAKAAAKQFALQRNRWTLLDKKYDSLAELLDELRASHASPEFLHNEDSKKQTVLELDSHSDHSDMEIVTAVESKQKFDTPQRLQNRGNFSGAERRGRGAFHRAGFGSSSQNAVREQSNTWGAPAATEVANSWGSPAPTNDNAPTPATADTPNSWGAPAATDAKSTEPAPADWGKPASEPTSTWGPPAETPASWGESAAPAPSTWGAPAPEATATWGNATASAPSSWGANEQNANPSGGSSGGGWNNEGQQGFGRGRGRGNYSRDHSRGFGEGGDGQGGFGERRGRGGFGGDGQGGFGERRGRGRGGFGGEGQNNFGDRRGRGGFGGDGQGGFGERRGRGRGGFGGDGQNGFGERRSWGRGGSGGEANTGRSGGWGQLSNANAEAPQNSWGTSAVATEQNNSWGAPAVTAEEPKGWGAPAVAAEEPKGWGAPAASDEQKNGWSAPATKPEEANAWGAPAPTDSENKGWGAPAKAEQTSGWGAPATKSEQDGGGASASPNPNLAWGAPASETQQPAQAGQGESSWGATPATVKPSTETAEGWGAPAPEVSASWGTGATTAPATGSWGATTAPTTGGWGATQNENAQNTSGSTWGNTNSGMQSNGYGGRGRGRGGFGEGRGGFREGRGGFGEGRGGFNRGRGRNDGGFGHGGGREDGGFRNGRGRDYDGGFGNGRNRDNDGGYGRGRNRGEDGGFGRWRGEGRGGGRGRGNGDAFGTGNTFGSSGWSNKAGGEQNNSWGAPATQSSAANAWGAPANSAPVENAWGAPANNAPAENAWGAPANNAPAENAWGAPANNAPVENAWGAPANNAPVENAWGAPAAAPRGNWGSNATSNGQASFDAAKPAVNGEEALEEGEVRGGEHKKLEGGADNGGRCSPKDSPWKKKFRRSQPSFQSAEPATLEKRVKDNDPGLTQTSRPYEECRPVAGGGGVASAPVKTEAGEASGERDSRRAAGAQDQAGTAQAGSREVSFESKKPSSSEESRGSAG